MLINLFLFITFQNTTTDNGDFSMRVMQKEQELNAEPLPDQDEERYTSFNGDTKSKNEN